MISFTKGPIARGTIRTSFVLGLRLIVQAGTLLLVARMLGPREFGAFAGVAALAVILGALSTFGMHLVLLGEVSRDPVRRRETLSRAVPVTLLCGICLFAGYLAICTSLLRVAGLSVGVLVAIGVTETLLQPLFALPCVIHLALGRVARSQLLTILPLGLRLLTAGLVFLLAPVHPLAAYAWGYLAASIIALMVGNLTVPSLWPPIRTWRLPDRGELHEAMGYAVLSITRTGPAELDKALATRLLTLDTAGVYAAGARVIGAITLPVTAMMLSSLPRLFREGQIERRRTRRLLRWMFAGAAGYSIALAGILWMVAPVFDWVFGAHYHGLDETIRWLCLAVPGMALRMTAGNVLLAVGKPWMRVAFEAFGLLVMVTASVPLTEGLGMIGMPLGLMCSEWSMAVTGLLLVRNCRR